MTTALIYCAGVGERWSRGWPDGQPKQLAPIEGKSILAHTVDQFVARDVVPVVIGFDERLRMPLAEFQTPPKLTRWLVETIACTSHMWRDERMIGVFGDVFFSEETMNAICRSTGTRFFGRKGQSFLTGGPAEVFGFAWDRQDSAQLLESIQMGVEDAEKMDPVWHKGKYAALTTEPGSIWQPYRFYCGFDPYERKWEPVHWVDCNDWTDDMDTPQRYELYVKRYAHRWVKDSD